MSGYSEVVNISSQEKPSQIPKFHPPNESRFFRDTSAETDFRVVYVNFSSDVALKGVLSSILVMVSVETIYEFQVVNTKPEFQAKPVFVSELTNKPLLGIKRWQSEVQYPDEAELRAECEQYMAEFNAREKLKLQREKEMSETPDEVCELFVTSVCGCSNCAVFRMVG